MSKPATRAKRQAESDLNGPLEDAELSVVAERDRHTINRWHGEGLKRRADGAAVIRWLAHRGETSQTERLRVAQTDRLVFDLRARQGQYVEFEFVKQLLMGMAADLGARLDGLPGRVAAEFAGSNDAAYIRQRLLDETRAIRSSFAEATRDIAEAANTRLGSDADGGADAAPESDAGSVGGSVPGSANGKRGTGSVED